MYTVCCERSLTCGLTAKRNSTRPLPRLRLSRGAGKSGHFGSFTRLTVGERPYIHPRHVAQLSAGTAHRAERARGHTTRKGRNTGAR